MEGRISIHGEDADISGLRSSDNQVVIKNEPEIKPDPDIKPDPTSEVSKQRLALELVDQDISDATQIKYRREGISNWAQQIEEKKTALQENQKDPNNNLEALEAAQRGLEIEDTAMNAQWDQNFRKIKEISDRLARITRKTSGSYEVIVKELPGKSIYIHALPNMTVDQLMFVYAQSQGHWYPAEFIRFVLTGRQMERGRILADYQIEEGSTIYSLIRLRGD